MNREDFRELFTGYSGGVAAALTLSHAMEWGPRVELIITLVAIGVVGLLLVDAYLDGGDEDEPPTNQRGDGEEVSTVG